MDGTGWLLDFERFRELITNNEDASLKLKEMNTCHIINIGSILGKTNRAKTAAYSATKYGYWVLSIV